METGFIRDAFCLVLFQSTFYIISGCGLGCSLFMAQKKPLGSQLNIQDIANEIANDATAIGSIATGVTTDAGAQATLDADYLRKNGVGIGSPLPITDDALVYGGSPLGWSNAPVVNSLKVNFSAFFNVLMLTCVGSLKFLLIAFAAAKSIFYGLLRCGKAKVAKAQIPFWEQHIQIATGS